MWTSLRPAPLCGLADRAIASELRRFLHSASCDGALKTCWHAGNRRLASRVRPPPPEGSPSIRSIRGTHDRAVVHEARRHMQLLDQLAPVRVALQHLQDEARRNRQAIRGSWVAKVACPRWCCWPPWSNRCSGGTTVAIASGAAERGRNAEGRHPSFAVTGACARPGSSCWKASAIRYRARPPLPPRCRGLRLQIRQMPNRSRS